MSNITLRIDDSLKNQSQKILDQMGLSMNTAVNLFLHQLCTDRGLPFRPSADPFDSPANQAHLAKAVRQIEEGKVVIKTLDELEAREK